MPKQRPTLTGRNVKRRGGHITEDDLDHAEPTTGGGVTSGETVTLGAGSDQQPQRQAPTPAPQQ